MVLHDHDVTVYQYEKLGMTILSIPSAFDFLYQPDDTATVASIAQRAGYRYVVNGSYFHGNRTHAGRLSIHGKVFSQKFTDRQLTHIVIYDTKSRTIRYSPTERRTSSPREGLIEFQTGPLVIHNGRLARKLIEGSINGRGLYRRTLFATTDLNHVFLITVRARVSLQELGEFLLKASVFSEKRLDVINLDGGSSVALYAKTFPQVNFNHDARLPILLGVH